jgi:hypothetical protein
MDGDREAGAIACRQVAVTVGRDALAVQPCTGWRAAVRQDGDRAGAVDAVARARGDLAEDRAPKGACALGRDAAAAAVGEREALVRLGARDLDLVDAAADVQRGGSGGGRKQAGERGEDGGGSETDGDTLSWPTPRRARQRRGSSLSLPHRVSVLPRKT